MSRKRIPPHHVRYVKAYLSLDTIVSKLKAAADGVWELQRAFPNKGHEQRDRSHVAAELSNQIALIDRMLREHPLTIFLNGAALEDNDGV